MYLVSEGMQGEMVWWTQMINKMNECHEQVKECSLRLGLFATQIAKGVERSWYIHHMLEMHIDMDTTIKFKALKKRIKGLTHNPGSI